MTSLDSLNEMDFDGWKRLFQHDPETFEKYRLRVLDSLIETAPEHAKARLQGMKFQIEAERARSKTALDYQMRLSAMMTQSLQSMMNQLHNIDTHIQRSDDKSNTDSAKILIFSKNL